MKKIAFINENFEIGGLQRVTSLIGMASSEKYEVYFYSMFSNENFYGIKKNFYHGDTKKIKGLKFLKLGMIFNGISVLFSGQYNLNRYYKRDITLLIDWLENKKIDVAIFSGSFAISISSFLGKESNVKVIGWAHNNFDIYMDLYAKKTKNAYIVGLKQANGLVCLTNYDLSKFSIYNSKTRLIYNPLTLKNTIISSLSAKNISFTCRIDYKHKGIDYLIQVAKLLPVGWTITIAGSGSKDQVERLKKDIKSNSLQDVVIYQGALKGEKLKKHYLESSIYLMTSRWEGFGLVLTEAMSFGLPIIAFSQSGSDEVLDNGKYGILVDNGNVKELSKQILKLTENLELRMKYQEKSLQRIKDFDLENIKNQWTELIESL